MAFCPKHSDCEAPISAIINILTKKDPSKLKEISDEFKLLGFDKVKDLANSSNEKIRKMNCLGEDVVAKLNEALEIYDEYCAYQLKSATLEYNQKNFDKTQQICKEMLLQKPYDSKFSLLLANSYFDCEEYDNCIAFLKEANDKNPNCAEVLYKLGLCYLSKSQLGEALVCFRNAMNKDSNFAASAWTYIAKIFILQNLPEAARFAFLQALCLKPKLTDVRNEYALLLLSKNEIKEAELQFKIATEITPECVDTWKNMGDLYINTSRIKEAITCYKKALELNDTSSITWYNLGRAYFKIKEYQNAIYSFQKALVLCPENINVMKNLAIVYVNQQNWSLAIDIYKNVLKFQPDDLDSNLQLGLVYNHLTNYQEAGKYFKNTLNTHSQNEELYKHLIIIYQKLGDNKSAYEVAISLGDMLYDRNDYEKAKKAYTGALDLDRENVIAHWKLGNVMYKLGDIDTAFARYKICLEMKPNFTNAYIDCGLICEQKNLPKKALDYYEVAYALNPNNSTILQSLMKLKEKLGETIDDENIDTSM